MNNVTEQAVTEQVRAIMARYPRLCLEGHGLSDFKRRTPEEYDAELAIERGRLAAPGSVAEIAAAADWIAGHWAPRQTVNRNHSSYGLKHYYEAAPGGEYVTNGQFIVALLLAGFTAPMDDGLNPSFAISEPSGMRRQRFTLGMASQLRAALAASDPAKDAPELREALRNLVVAIMERHEQWPES